MLSEINLIHLVLLIAFFCFSFGKASGQDKNDIKGIWYNTEKDARIEIYSCANNKFCGKIVWLKDPNENGKAKVDKNNPDKSLSNRPIIGMNILEDLTFNPDQKAWEDGKIYDPKNGKTYSCNIKLKTINALEVRGYVGFSLLGRTVTWSKAN